MYLAFEKRNSSDIFERSPFVEKGLLPWEVWILQRIQQSLKVIYKLVNPYLSIFKGCNSFKH